MRRVSGSKQRRADFARAHFGAPLQRGVELLRSEALVGAGNDQFSSVLVAFWRKCAGREQFALCGHGRLHPATRSQLEHGAGGRIRLDKRHSLRVVDTEPVKQGGQTIAGAHALFANKLMGCGVEAGNLRGQIGHGQLFDQHRHGQIGSIR